jgi:mono/diheme cytochrome c family protein
MKRGLALAVAASVLVLSTALAHDVNTDATEKPASVPDTTMAEPAAPAPADSAAAALVKVKDLFAKHCARCHGDKRPADGLRLSSEADLAALALTAGVVRDSFVMVAPGRPEASYLLMKIKGSDGIIGRRMPLAAKPLSEEDVAVVEEWIRGLAVPDTTSQPAATDSGNAND